MKPAKEMNYAEKYGTDDEIDEARVGIQKLIAQNPVPKELSTPDRFPLGRLLMTNAVRERFAPVEIMACLDRHKSGDWGEVPPEDAKENEGSLSPENPGRLLSAYSVAGEKIWIITEADRSSTTVLFPKEY